MDEIHSVIGYAVSILLEAGKPMHMKDIAALLQQHIELTSDEALKDTFRHAIRLVANKMN